VRNCFSAGTLDFWTERYGIFKRSVMIVVCNLILCNAAHVLGNDNYTDLVYIGEKGRKRAANISSSSLQLLFLGLSFAIIHLP